jgi:DNA-binding MarR family transcriptional regulator
MAAKASTRRKRARNAATDNESPVATLPYDLPPLQNDAELNRIRHEHLGWLLERAHRMFARTVSRAVQARGFADVRLVHVKLIRSVEARGTRITDIARWTGMSKQATGQLVSEFARLGYIRVVPDASDGRIKIAEYTAKGKRLLRAIVEAIAEAELRVAASIGAAELKELKGMLTRLIVFTEEE